MAGTVKCVDPSCGWSFDYLGDIYQEMEEGGYICPKCGKPLDRSGLY